MDLRQPWDDRPPPAPLPLLWIRAWFEDPDQAAVESSLMEFWAAAEPVWCAVEEEDWEESWKRAFPRLEVAAGLTLSPPWLAQQGDIIIDPGQGFGTGHHPSTRAILESTWSICPGHDSFLDVGCGSGVLALAAARAGLTAHGVDLDADALANARHNAELNGLDATFDDTAIDALTGIWDVVAANLYAELLVPFAPALTARTGKVLLLAGIMTTKATQVRAAYDPHFGAPQVDVRGPWTSLIYRRTS